MRNQLDEIKLENWRKVELLLKRRIYIYDHDNRKIFDIPFGLRLDGRKFAEVIVRVPEIIRQREELLNDLKSAMEEIKILQKQVPASQGYNLATESGKMAWEAFSGKMVKFENTIRKVEDFNSTFKV